MLDDATVLLTTFAVLCASYAILSSFFDKTRQKAWILSAFASGTMTVCSLPFVWDYLKHGFEGVDARASFAVPVNRVFQGYLAADLFIGAIFYRSQINILTGWVHHIVYLGICEFTVRCGWAFIFALCAVMEFPTFILALGTLFPRLRSDNIFAVTFFATRICMHLVLIYTFLFTHRPDASIAPAIILISVFPMHAMWFFGCIKGFLRRAKEQKPVKLTHPLAADVNIDARSLSRHASTTVIVPPWDVTLRLRRIRARVDRWAGTWVREGRVGRWASARRPLRPRAMARRMSDSIVQVLPSKEAMMQFVGWGV